MNINIPEKHRQEFDKSADFVIEKGSVTPDELAKHLNTGVFVASIMIGYLEKACLVTKGRGNEERHAKITPEQWDFIDKQIERYDPAPEPVIAEEIKETDISDIIPKKLKFLKKTLYAEEGFITIECGKEKTAILPDDVTVIFLHKGGLFSKSTMTFSTDGETPVKAKSRSDTISFKNSIFDEVKVFAQKLGERIDAEIKIF